ncbi:MAG: flavodoxin domain-containing protein [Saccharospirillaceae bacterium]|nr:flavodoxin domain-containing protein [Saccharospirillaceae bacterium]
MISLQPWAQATLLILGWCLLTLWCFRTALRQRWHNRRAAHRRLSETVAPVTVDPVVVAYASEGGTAVALAGDLAQQLEQGGETVSLLPLNQLSPKQLSVSHRLLIIASTYGDGEAPTNGQHFIRRLQQALKQRQPVLQNLRYAVLALATTTTRSSAPLVCNCTNSCNRLVRSPCLRRCA